MSRFVCPEHGEIVPEKVNYSYPACAPCPQCGRVLYDEVAGARLRSSGSSNLSRQLREERALAREQLLDAMRQALSDEEPMEASELLAYATYISKLYEKQETGHG